MWSFSLIIHFLFRNRHFTTPFIKILSILHRSSKYILRLFINYNNRKWLNIWGQILSKILSSLNWCDFFKMGSILPCGISQAGLLFRVTLIILLRPEARGPCSVFYPIWIQNKNSIRNGQNNQIWYILICFAIIMMFFTK